MSLCPSLEQNLIDENQNFFNGNYSYIFFKQSTYFLELVGQFFPKECKILPKIFGIFGFKSSKLRRFFDIWKWTEHEDGSSDKNLRRSKIFEALLQLWHIYNQFMRVSNIHVMYVTTKLHSRWILRNINIQFMRVSNIHVMNVT